MKKAIILALTTTLIFAFAACAVDDNQDSSSAAVSDTQSSVVSNGIISTPPEDPIDRFTEFDQDDSTSDSAVRITLSGDTATADGSGVTVEGSVVRITSPGNYVISGNLTDGQIIVNVTKEEKVHIVLNGVTVSNSNTAAFYIASADKVSITLARDSVNTFSDATVYTTDVESGPNACIYSKDDLTINGSGTLNVKGNFNNGITSKNDLKIISGTINVTSRNNGLKGNDTVQIKGGTILVESNDDGIKVSNALEIEKGYIYIEGGAITIISNDDALQATNYITIKGGTVTTKAGGKALNCDTTNITDGCLIKK